MNNKSTLSPRNMAVLLIFGMIGQIAWSVENMYFNLFVFEEIAPSLETVTLMVQASGVVATLVTLVAGSLSDKVGNRRTFISLGYMYNTYQMYLYPEHPMYMFVDGEFRSLSEVAYNASIVANDASQTATENAASINTLQDQISMKVSQTTYDSDHNAIEQRLSNVEQSASDFKVEITRSVADQIAEVSGDVDELAEEMAGFRDTVTGYMDFNGDSLAIGVVGSSFKTEITNTEMAFTENGEKVAYVSNNDMYITRARVTDTLSVGTVDNGYVDFVTLPGGLALKWRNAATS